jgi:uncharacterized linocin/CFP29 family protein
MNNLHRELAPISAAAWDEIEAEAGRTFKRHLAGRRVVDVVGPGGPGLASVGTGHLLDLAAPGPGVIARQREAVRLVELRVPFVVDRQATDGFFRGCLQAHIGRGFLLLAQHPLTLLLAQQFLV